MDDLELLVKEIKEGNIEPGSPIDHIRLAQPKKYILME